MHTPHDAADTPYRNGARHHMRVPTYNNEPSLTKQEFLAESDINNLMARYMETGVPPRENPQTPSWGDWDACDLLDSLTLVKQAQEAFSELPSSLRNRFENDPAKLLQWVHDPHNHEEAIELGFLEAETMKSRYGWKPKAPPAPTQSDTTNT